MRKHTTYKHDDCPGITVTVVGLGQYEVHNNGIHLGNYKSDLMSDDAWVEGYFAGRISASKD